MLRSLNVDHDAQDSYGFHFLVTHRADLCKILYEEALNQDVTVRFGCSVQHIDFARPAVQLSTGETVAADLVLGADGARSVCREAMLGHTDTPKRSGKLIYRVCIDMDTMSRNPLSPKDPYMARSSRTRSLLRAQRHLQRRH